jgi:hypothetical protein
MDCARFELLVACNSLSNPIPAAASSFDTSLASDTSGILYPFCSPKIRKLGHAGILTGAGKLFLFSNFCNFCVNQMKYLFYRPSNQTSTKESQD